MHIYTKKHQKIIIILLVKISVYTILFSSLISALSEGLIQKEK